MWHQWYMKMFQGPGVSENGTIFEAMGAEIEVAKDFQYIHVSNLDNVDLDLIFIPLPAISQPTPTRRPKPPSVIFSKPSSTKRPVVHNPSSSKPTISSTETSIELLPDSPIGYETQCGIRGTRPKDGRIVGGTNAEPGEFPWQVSLQLTSGRKARHICGGAILSKHWVITAAHCVAGVPTSSITLVAGDHDLYRAEGHEQRVKVVRSIIKGYKKDNFANDIAMLQVSPALKIDGKRIAPICIPKHDHSFPSGYGIVTGWGRLSESGNLPSILQRVTLPLIERERCQELYKKAGYSSFLHSCQLCSGWEQGGSDSCQGDSGGPMACKRPDGLYYLCGIVSWGIGCARPRFPGVYTEVTCFSSWIHDIVYAQNNQQLLAESDNRQ